MKSLLLSTVILFSGFVSLQGIAQESEDAYDKAYEECSAKATDQADRDYDEVFTECMRQKGFADEESYGETNKE